MRQWIDLFETWNTEDWFNPKLSGEDAESGGYFERFGVPAEVESRYSNAQCTYLALAMAERYGWQIRAEMMSHEPTHIAHAYCVLPNGQEIDILGPQEKVDQFDGGTVRDFTQNEMREFISHDKGDVAGDLEDARMAVELFIEPYVKEGVIK